MANPILQVPKKKRKREKIKKDFCVYFIQSPAKTRFASDLKPTMFPFTYLLPFHQIFHPHRMVPFGDGEGKQVLLFSHGKRHGCLGLGDLEFLVNGKVQNTVVTQAASPRWALSCRKKGRHTAHGDPCHLALHPEMDRHSHLKRPVWHSWEQVHPPLGGGKAVPPKKLCNDVFSFHHHGNVELPRRCDGLLCWHDNFRALFLVLYRKSPYLFLMTTLWSRYCWCAEREREARMWCIAFPGTHR